MKPPPEILWFRIHIEEFRRRAKDAGGVTLEWMVVAAALFLVAVWAAARIVAAVREEAGKIK